MDTIQLPKDIVRNSQEHVDWLMRERILVIKNWPFMPKWYNVGATVLEKDEYDRVTLLHIPGNGSFVESFGSTKDYPHLFRPLQWWEHRSEEQVRAVGFIKYKSLTTGGIVVKAVKKWYFEKGQPPAYNHQFSYLMNNIYQPATRAEYEQFINVKK